MHELRELAFCKDGPRRKGSISTEQIFVGIDVSKVRLDIALRPSGKEWSEANGDRGIAEIVAHLEDLDPILVVLEATGGLQLPLAEALATAQMPVVVVKLPRHQKDFLPDYTVPGRIP